MTQEQLDALLAQIGGGRLIYAPTSETKKIPNPARISADGTTDYTVPKDLDVTIQRWHDPTSGRVIEAYQGADGTWTVTRNSTDKALVNVGAPEPGAQAAPRNVNGVPSVVIGRTEDGRPIYGPVQTEAGPAQAAPAAPKPSVIQVEGTPDPSKPGGFDNDRPVMASHWPDGRITYEPLSPAERQEWERQQGRGPKAQPTTKQGAVTGYPGWTFVTQTDGNNETTLYYAPGDSTHPLRSLPAKPEGAPQPSTRVVKGGDGKEYIQSITFDQQGQPTAIKNYGPDGNPVAAIPGEAPDKGTVVSRNGQQFTVRAGKDANGNPTVETYDAQGRRLPGGLPAEQKPGTTRYNPDTGEYDEVTTDANGRTVVRTVPREGAPSGAAGGPAMPAFVVGAASQSLTDYHNALRNDPTLTPAQRERRFQEALQAATMAVNEAHIEQTDLDSTRSYNFNVASTKLNYYQQGLGQALNFVARFNDKLPPNSPLGGQALRAMLGIQMLQMNASGINQLNPGGVPTQPRFPNTRGSSGTGPGPVTPGAAASAAAPAGAPIPAPPTPAELNDPEALERKRQEIMAHPAFKPPPPVEGPATPATAPTAPTTPAPPPAPAAPAPMPTVTPPVSAAPPPDAPVGDGYIAVRSLSNQTDGWILQSRYDPARHRIIPPDSPTLRRVPPPGPLAAPYTPPAPGPGSSAPTPPVSTAPPAPEPAPAAMTAPPPPPREDFAVLNQMRPPEPAAPEAPAVAPPPTPDLPTPPAMLRMQAMTTPPWRLPAPLIERMRAAGIPDSVIFSVPGRQAIA